MQSVHKCEFTYSRPIRNERVHQFNDLGRIQLTVNDRQFFKVVWNWLLEYRNHLLYRQGIDGIHLIDQGLEVFHLGNTFKNYG